MRKGIIREIEIKFLQLIRLVVIKLNKLGVFNFLDSRFRNMIMDTEFIEKIHISIESICEKQPGKIKWLFEKYPMELIKTPDFDEVKRVIGFSNINRYKIYYIESLLRLKTKESKHNLFWGSIVIDTLINICLERKEIKTMKSFGKKYQT